MSPGDETDRRARLIFTTARGHDRPRRLDPCHRHSDGYRSHNQTPIYQTMKMNDKQVWYGYLEAGNKSTAVVLDRTLNTGNPETLYLFNLARGEILEYSRKIVEPKLSELKTKEMDLTTSLKSAYDTALSHFTPRAIEILDIPERAAPAKKPAPAKPEEEEAASLAVAGELGDADEAWEEDEEDEEEDET